MENTFTAAPIRSNSKAAALAQAITGMGKALAEVGREYAITGKAKPSHETFVKLAKTHNIPAAADVLERYFTAGYAAIN